MQVCQVCGGAGSLRDGGLCPMCGISRRKFVDDRLETQAERKRAAWIRSLDPDRRRAITERRASSGRD